MSAFRGDSFISSNFLFLVGSVESAATGYCRTSLHKKQIHINYKEKIWWAKNMLPIPKPNTDQYPEPFYSPSILKTCVPSLVKEHEGWTLLIPTPALNMNLRQSHPSPVLITLFLMIYLNDTLPFLIFQLAIFQQISSLKFVCILNPILATSPTQS